MTREPFSERGARELPPLVPLDRQLLPSRSRICHQHPPTMKWIRACLELHRSPPETPRQTSVPCTWAPAPQQTAA